MVFLNTRFWAKSTIASSKNAATTSPAPACFLNGLHITATSLSADSLSLIPREESPSMVALASDDASTKEGASSPSFFGKLLPFPPRRGLVTALRGGLFQQWRDCMSIIPDNQDYLLHCYSYNLLSTKDVYGN